MHTARWHLKIDMKLKLRFWLFDPPSQVYRLKHNILPFMNVLSCCARLAIQSIRFWVCSGVSRVANTAITHIHTLELDPLLCTVEEEDFQTTAHLSSIV